MSYIICEPSVKLLPGKMVESNLSYFAYNFSLENIFSLKVEEYKEANISIDKFLKQLGEFNEQIVKLFSEIEDIEIKNSGIEKLLNLKNLLITIKKNYFEDFSEEEAFLLQEEIYILEENIQDIRKFFLIRNQNYLSGIQFTAL